jgi:HAE1 family hydrophobic/amphiphilic exporter-1
MKAEGMALKPALLEATRKRFRPIVMTTLAMVAGMMPIALAQGAGAEWKNGIAWVIIGGLISSMFLTLVIVPLVYYLVDRGVGKKK